MLKKTALFLKDGFPKIEITEMGNLLPGKRRWMYIAATVFTGF